MKFLTRFFCLAAAGLLLSVSCAKEESESYDKYEDQSLKAWITQNRKDLLKNYQSDGGYYVDITPTDQSDAPAVNDTVCWVRFDFSGRDLSGNLVLTRRAAEAKLAGTYTKYTHYTPFYRFCGEENTSLLEGTYLSMRNTLTLGEEYAAAKGIAKDYALRIGDQIVLYMPSRVVGSAGVEGDAGYEGQYTLDSKRPFIVTMKMLDRVKNPLEAEGTDVDAFCEFGQNGGLKIFSKKDESKTSSSTTLPSDIKDPNHPYNVKERWVSACDTVPQLYVNYRFDPKEILSYPEPYNVGYEPYNNLAEMEKQISEALVKRFHTDAEVEYKNGKELDADSVKLDGTAKIWYIGRLLDGFIFDTNIDEVKKIIYGEVVSAGSALSYKPEDGELINAFYYTIPNMKFGQWGALITTSTNAYGSTGQVGKTSSSSSSTSNGYSSSYYDYMNYMNYANSYYGSSGYYGGYYNNYYNGYYGGYYNNYGSSSDSGDTTTTTTLVYTEIAPFTPLIFEFYIEPATAE